MEVGKYVVGCFMQMYVLYIQYLLLEINYQHKTMTNIVQKPSQVLHLA